MTSTNAKDFEKFVKLLPKNVLEDIWFFPIRQDGKNPDVPGGGLLKNNLKYRLHYGDCIARLKSGKNVGIYATYPGLMFFDLDVSDGKMNASPELLEKLTKTLTVQTRNGGRQFYYLNEGIYANQLVKEKEKIIGELRTDWWYVVSVGSYVPTDKNNSGGDGTYRLISENQPISEFQDIGLNLKLRVENKKEKDTKKYDHENPDNQTSAGKHLRELANIGIQTRVRR